MMRTEEEEEGFNDALFTMSSGGIPMARHSSEVEGEGDHRQKVHVLSLPPHLQVSSCHPACIFHSHFKPGARQGHREPGLH